MADRYYIATFGCRTNQADTAAIRQQFTDASYCETFNPQEADVIVVNSCTVTHRSDQQVRQLTRRFRRGNPKAKLILTGCYAQRDPGALASISGVTAVVGNTRKRDLVQIASQQEPRAPSYDQIAALYLDDFSKVRSIDRPALASTELGGKTRPFVKIQDGCDAKCAYCIIPTVRGPSRSVPPEQVRKHVRDLVRSGFREIVLTGIHLGTYGLYLRPRFSLDRLLCQLIEIEGLGQIRISSIEPMELSNRVIDLACQTDKVAPHFHICLQSGSDSVLRRMLRPYDTKKFARIVERIRAEIPLAAIGTDLIAGFPGETLQEHRETLAFVRDMPFTYLHVFPYSDRSGTPASRMTECKVHPETITRRASQLRSISDRKNRDFRESFVGQRLKVLSLTSGDGRQREALTANYLKASLPADVDQNQLLEARVEKIKDDRLVMTPISS